MGIEVMVRSLFRDICEGVWVFDRVGFLGF